MIWQARNISRHFHRRLNLWQRERLDVLCNLNLSVRKGEILALVGVSGSGKSSLANIALRLDEPTGGQLYLDGKSYSEYQSRQEFYRTIQIVFQHSPDSFNPNWTVRQVLAEPLRNLTDCTSAAYAANMQTMLCAVGLPVELLDEKVQALSGGQAQRVNIARALISQPRFLVLDEPTSNLDVQTQQQILKLLKKIQTEQNLAILLISHDLTAVTQIADRVAFMDNGCITEILASSDLDKASTPVARKLLKSSNI
mgnify:CR=1 FL=1